MAPGLPEKLSCADPSPQSTSTVHDEPVSSAKDPSLKLFERPAIAVCGSGPVTSGAFDLYAAVNVRSVSPPMLLKMNPGMQTLVASPESTVNVFATPVHSLN